MSGAECIVNRFVASQKPAQSAVCLDGMKLISPPRQYLVCVGLVPYVPHELVVWRVKNIVHRDRDLDRTETRARVAADPRAGVDNELASFVRDFLRLLDT